MRARREETTGELRSKSKWTSGLHYVGLDGIEVKKCERGSERRGSMKGKHSITGKSNAMTRQDNDSWLTLSIEFLRSRGSASKTILQN